MIEYDSAQRPPPFVDEFVQLLRYRDLILLMVGNILKNRYKRSMLRIFWMLLNPLLQTYRVGGRFRRFVQIGASPIPGLSYDWLLAWSFLNQTM